MSSSSSVNQAREALGRRLHELRLDAGLTARALAALCGWHESKSSRIEHGKMTPSDEDLRAWATHCRVPEQVPDLIAVARGIEGMYVEWRRMERTGLKHAQESVLPLWDRTRHFRAYASWLIPRPLQTPAYVRPRLLAVLLLSVAAAALSSGLAGSHRPCAARPPDASAAWSGVGLERWPPLRQYLSDEQEARYG